MYFESSSTNLHLTACLTSNDLQHADHDSDDSTCHSFKRFKRCFLLLGAPVRPADIPFNNVPGAMLDQKPTHTFQPVYSIP